MNSLQRRYLMALFIFGLFLYLASLLNAENTEVKTIRSKPNIIFILTDDLGFGDLGVLFQNQRKEMNIRSKPWHMTPYLDQFAAQGAQLPHHYCAAPVCAPSRASILLGVSQGHANVRDNQFDKALENNHTVATVLKEAGYSTAAFGKWGLQGSGSNPQQWPAFPTKRGFDFFLGYVTHVAGHEHYPKEMPYVKDKQSPKKIPEVWDNQQNIREQLDLCYTTDLWTAAAKKWIVEHQQKTPDQPFFIYLAYDTPHAVIELPTQAYPAGGGIDGGIQWTGKPGSMINTASGVIDSWMDADYRNATYDHDSNPQTPEIPWPDVYKRYATSVRRIDSAVGDLQKLMSDLKIDDNTLIVFTSDNGPSCESYLKETFLPVFFAGWGPFDGIKRDCLEGGIRVPTLARWPAVIPAGTIVGEPSISYDWMATFADMAGIPTPARSDGASLIPILKGGKPLGEPRGLYVEYLNDSVTPDFPDFTPSNRNRIRGQMQMIRWQNFVGLRYNTKSESDPFEIFNIPQDPKQAINIASSHPDLEKKMREIALQSRRPEPSAPRPYDRALIPCDHPQSVQPGVAWSFYQGNFPWVAKDGLGNPFSSGKTDLVNLGKNRDNSPGEVIFQGYLKIPNDGEYQFELQYNCKALFKIHEATVIDADYSREPGKQMKSSIMLTAGFHSFRLYCLKNKDTNSALKLYWSNGTSPKGEVPPSVLFH